MKVPFDRADDHRALALALSGGQVRLEDLKTHLHYLGRFEHLGNEQIPSAEAFAHHVHRGNQPFVENGGNVRAAIQLRLGLGLYRRLVVGQYRIENILDCHVRFSFAS